MKMKRIIAGITACTIVGSTMLTMPVSAKTTTKVTEVSLSDLINTAKMASNLKDDITAEKQAELLDKFDTNGNGTISINEVLAVAKRIARTDENDIVNEYGTADSEETTTETTLETSETEVTTTEVTTTEETTETTEETTTTEETSETTVDTTETTETTTTEETTTTTAALEPIVKINGTEYSDGDTIILKEEVGSVEVSDENYEVNFSLEGEKDDDGNDKIEVYGSKF